MKKDTFKDFIDEHKEEFDFIEPSESTWKGIDTEIRKEKRLFDSKVFLRIAASLFLILGAAWIALQIINLPVDNFAEKTEDSEINSEYVFSEMSDELAEVEHYYVSEVSLKESELSNYKVDKDLLEEVDFLKEEFEQLKFEMENSADPMKVVEAMINNYQLRLEILQSILDQLEKDRERNIQNVNDESYV